MSALSADNFRAAVTEKYRTLTGEMSRAELISELQQHLRIRFVRMWDRVQLLESLIAHPTSGDPDAILSSFYGDLDAIVEQWQQSILSLPRVVLRAEFHEFRVKLLDRYDSSPESLTENELTARLDSETELSYGVFYALSFQLHYISDRLMQSPDRDLAEQGKEELNELVDHWQKALLQMPRAVLKQEESKSKHSEI